MTDEEWQRQASKMFDLAMDLDEQVSHMMNEPEQVQDTLAKLVALYPESLSLHGFRHVGGIHQAPNAIS